MRQMKFRLVHSSCILLFIIAMPLLSACSIDEGGGGAVTARELRGDLEAIARARIFFGHQSVGRNILQGVAELAAEAGVALPVAKLDDGATAANKGLIHAEIGRNNDPAGKIVAFANVLNRSGSNTYDLVILKFCYVDLSAEGTKDPLALIEQYQRAVLELRAAHPGLRIVHVTVPLRSDPLEWKTPLKRLLGRETYEDADNRLRYAYNTELRRRFAGDAIFDIAEVESTRPDGSRSGFADGRGTVYTLAREYTSDGGHLNSLGRQVVARAYVQAIAKALGTGQ